MNFDLSTMFYVGSCRYQPLFTKNFPPRLHSTKEIIYFLENYDKIELTTPDIDYIYADIVHPGVIRDSVEFIKKSNTIFNNVDTLVIELCSRKVCIINNIPYSDYKNNGKFTSSVLTYDDIKNDLVYIKRLIQNKFNINKLLVISHVSLPLKQSNMYINDREQLCTDLENICNELTIDFINPGKLYTNVMNTNLFLEDVLPDTIHYEDNEYMTIITNEIQQLYEF
jgi:hypothetical protein